MDGFFSKVKCGFERTRKRYLVKGNLNVGRYGDGDGNSKYRCYNHIGVARINMDGKRRNFHYSLFCVGDGLVGELDAGDSNRKNGRHADGIAFFVGNHNRYCCAVEPYGGRANTSRNDEKRNKERGGTLVVLSHISLLAHTTKLCCVVQV